MDYLKKDLGNPNVRSWAEIREAYCERAAKLIANDYQAPSYLSSGNSQAGRREGQIIGNINDYTRDQHDLSQAYEKKFAKEYLPTQMLLPTEAYVTSSGMAALTTVIMMLHRQHGTRHTIMVGKHSYFQNLEALSGSFERVVFFDESDVMLWQQTYREEKPLAVFVDSLCNESELHSPDVLAISELMKKISETKCYLVVDNSMLGPVFPFNKLLKSQSKNLNIVVWESLNKYYQYGLDRVTGGVLWGSRRLSAKMFRARINAGTIMPDWAVAMLPTPNMRVMKEYLLKIEENSALMQQKLRELVNSNRVEIIRRAITKYEFNGAQIVVEFVKKPSYEQIQKMIRKIIVRARREGVELVAGSSFGMPNTRVYLTARQTEYAQMFLRISVGMEEVGDIEKIAKVIGNSL